MKHQRRGRQDRKEPQRAEDSGLAVKAEATKTEGDGINLNVQVTPPAADGPRQTSPPDAEAPQTDYEKALAYFGLKEDQILKVCGITTEVWQNTLQLEPSTPAVKIVTKNGRKCYWIPNAGFTDYWDGKPIDGGISFGQTGLMFHPVDLLLGPESGYKVLHESMDVNIIVRAKDAMIDKKAEAERLRLGKGATKGMSPGARPRD